MSWPGYFTLDGAEFINAARVEAYAADRSWFHAVYPSDLAEMRGEVYDEPALDTAPWYDPDVPASADFLGFYPSNIDGLDNSTRSATGFESTLEGGVPGRVRHAMKEVVFAGVILARSHEALDFGKTWLRRTLLGGLSSPRDARKQALGAELEYLGYQPRLDDVNASELYGVVRSGVSEEADSGLYIIDPDFGVMMEDPPGSGLYVSTQESVDDLIEDPPGSGLYRLITGRVSATAQAILDAATRRLMKVNVPNGPIFAADRKLSCGDWLANVQFTARCGDPTIYGLDQWLVTEYDAPEETVTWPPGSTEGTVTPTRVYLEEPCTPPTFQPLYDPTCAIVITPPTPPNVPFGCWTPPEEGDEWVRTTVTIPERNFDTWTEMLPSLVLNTTEEVRDLRVRFYADPESDADPDIDPCSALADWVISYIPASSEMWISGMFEEVYVTIPGGHRRRADSLVFATNMRPATWPALSAGVQHLVTVESRTDTWPEINLFVTPRAV